MRSTEGISVIVTGGGSGPGAATAAHMAGLGARVTVCGRRPEKVQSVAKSIGPKCAWVQADIDDPADRQRIVDTAVEHGGGIDVLINNAGNLYTAPFAELEEPEVLGLYQTNVISPMMLTQLALPQLVDRQGSVIFIGSVHVRRALPPAAMYAPTKAALHRLTGMMAAELGPQCVRVNCVAVAGAALTMDEPADLVNVAVEELVKERFELPAFSALDRLARKARHAANSRLFSRVDGGLSEEARAGLDALLEADAGGRSDLGLLKAPPRSATRKNLSEMQESLLWMESVGDTRLLLSGIPNQKVAHLAAQARALDASELKKVGPERRRAMLVSLVHRAKVGTVHG